MVKEWDFSEAKDRTIWIPNMCDAAYVISAALRGKGFDSKVLPRSKDPLMSLGRKYTDGDQCLPSIITTEDILTRVFSSDFKPGDEAFFQGKSEGPCRFGRYYMNQLLILEKLGFANVPIVTLDNRNSYGGLGSGFKILAWDGVFAQAMLERMLHFTRPFEVNEGESDKVYKESLEELCSVLENKIKQGVGKMDILSNRHNFEVLESLRVSADEFSRIEKRKEAKPVVFVTGEIYVRTSDVANQNLIRKIEKLGGVVLLEPTASFFAYVGASKLERRKYHVKEIGFFDALRYRLENYLEDRDTKDIERIFEVIHDPEVHDVIERGSKYVHPTFEGEAIVTLGGCDYFASKGVNGIINTMPHNCMPGVICTAKSSELREIYNIPFLNLSYDGHPDPNKDEQLEVFMYQIQNQ